MEASDTRPESGMKLYAVVSLVLLAIVGIEVWLTYAHLSIGSLLTALLVLAFAQSALVLMYFMRMRYERSILFWSMIPPFVFAMFMLDHVWPDAFRLMHMRPPTP